MSRAVEGGTAYERLVIADRCASVFAHKQGSVLRGLVAHDGEADRSDQGGATRFGLLDGLSELAGRGGGRAEPDEAAEHGRDRYDEEGGVGRYDPEQQENDRQAAPGGGELRHQDDLAAALDRRRSLFDLGFQPRDPIVRVGLLARWRPMSVGTVGLLWHCGFRSAMGALRNCS